MIKFKDHIFIFLLISALVSACKGQQIKSDINAIKIPATNTNSPKLIKTQGTDEYQIIGCSLRDRSGNLWFGSTGEGVYKYDGKEFIQFTTKDGLSSNIIISIIEDKSGDLWFASKGYISRYDGKKFTNIPIPGTIGSNILSKNDPQKKNELWSMMQDRKGTMWLGTSDGIYCFDGKLFTLFLDNKSIQNDNNVQLKWTQCIFEDKSGNIWFGSFVWANEGISRYDGNSIIQYKPYGEGWIREFLEDKNGELLVVTRHNGVCRFDGKEFTNFTQNGGIQNGSINTAFMDKKGILWFGKELGSGEMNEDGGLWRYDETSFMRYTKMHGLIHNGVYSIIDDTSGNLWIGSRNNDLCRFDGQTFTIFSE